MKKLLFLLSLALLWSCDDTFNLDTSNSEVGSMDIVIYDGLSRTLEPELSMEWTTITITVNGPNGEEYIITLDEEESYSLTNLKHGTWSVLAQAYNDDGTLIGQAESSESVHSGETNTVSMEIVTLEGEGTLNLSALWLISDVEDPQISASLTDSEGTIQVLDFTLDADLGTALWEGELSKGYYSLSICLYDGDFLSIGSMEIARIVADETTTGTFDFTEAKINGGQISVNIDVSINNPLAPIIDYDSNVVGLSEPIILSASVDEDLSGISYVWYEDGQSVALGESYTFKGDIEGPYQINLAAFTSDGSRAGSTGLSLYVSSEIENYTKISTIQGDNHTSPYVGETVEGVLGVITAVKETGFWMQSPTADDNPSTSEGLYVYTYTIHSYLVGDLVTVGGTVAEYGYDDELKLTELTYVTVEVIQSGYPLPSPIVIGTEGVLPPSEIICDDANETIYDSTFDPENDGIDFFESLESMLIEITDPVAVGGTKYGEIPVIPGGVSYSSETDRGGLHISEENYNPQILHIDTDAEILGLDSMVANLGDYFTSPIQGVVDYSYGKFLILPTLLPEIQSASVAREVSTLITDDEKLTVATFNIMNYPRDDDTMTDNELEAKELDIAQTIITGLGSPDIVALQEMTDDSYSDDDGVVSAQNNGQNLIDKITELGGPTYGYIEIEPEDGEEGGWPGANIRVAFLYNPDRVGFTAIGSPTATNETNVEDAAGEPQLTMNPGRFSLDSFEGSRKSMIAQFTFGGESLFIINNHFSSKSGDTALFGEYQPPVLSSETERHIQATAVKELVSEILAIDSDASVIVLGDLNDFQFSGTADILKESDVESLTENLLDKKEQYSYIYNGNSQQLDHIFASPSLLDDAQVEIVHRYSEFDSDSRETDHDPIVASFSFSDDTGTTGGSLFFSEYAEGSSNNKYLEIFNPSANEIDMDGYQVLRYNNGGTDASGTYDLTGSIQSMGLYIIMNSSADTSIVDLGDTSLAGITWYNGDDCLQLVNPSGEVIDQIGILGEDPGDAWPVGDTLEGTKEHTLVRKETVLTGNGGDWDLSAGSSSEDSQWYVFEQDFWENLGIHVTE